MFNRIIFILVLFVSVNSEAAIGRVATQEQLEKLCVEVLLEVDMDFHYFYYKSIERFDSTGLYIKYGRGKINHIPKEQILNYEDAKKSYALLKEAQP